MHLYHCILTFHDNLFYETRTAGRLYETGRDLHNIALTYALGLAQTTYFHSADVPNYGEEIGHVREAGVYVTPALGVNVQYEVNTFKFGTETDHVVEKPLNQNRPNFGRAKEIAVESRFHFGVLSEQARQLPRWIRMGLWMSKAQVEVLEIDLQKHTGRRTHLIDVYPLNPLDLPESARLGVFDLVSMRPSSLTENAEVTADSWWQGKLPDGRDVWLPEGMRYGLA